MAGRISSHGSGLGAPVRRLEDARLLTGRGRYTDDIQVDCQLFAVFVRSFHAHAAIGGIDTGLAAAAPGVAAVITAKDLRRNALVSPDGLPQMVARDGRTIFDPVHPVLATERVRFVGEPVAMVLAETQAQAREAAELVQIDYQSLPHVVNSRDALKPDAPVIWDDLGSNLALHWDNRDPDEIDRRLAGAAVRVRVEVVNNRVVPNPMEPRAVVAVPEPGSGPVILYAPTQGGRRIQRMLAQILGLPQEKVRVISPDTGGAFGIRAKCYPELAAVAQAALDLGRPVKWRGDRSETFVSDYHGRDQVNRAEMGLDREGRVVALKVETILNLGAYLAEFGARLPVAGGGRIIPCGYDIEHFHFTVKPVFTNTVCTDSYRGAGRPEANYLMERLMDAAAEACGLERDEIRRRNLVKPSQMPYRTQMGLTFDTGDFIGVMDKAMAVADWVGFPARRAASDARGRLRGLGLACFVEQAGGRPNEEMRVVLKADGVAEIYAGTFSQGQGHETAYAQILHEYLDVALDDVRLIQGDTALAPPGADGTYGSRSSMMGGVALKRACEQTIAKGTAIAAHLLQSEPDGVTFEDGHFRSGTGSLSLKDAARAATDPSSLPAGMEPGLEGSHLMSRAADSFNFPNGCHICEVEVDPETGVVEMMDYIAVDDCGTVINPLLVHGQLYGGVAQGVGQAFTEQVLYDADSGQLLNASFMDYGMPRAAHFSRMRAQFANIPSTVNELGIKGAGEAGVCGAPHAFVSAVMDALKPYGVRHIDMPLTPEKVWRAIRSGKERGHAG